MFIHGWMNDKAMTERLEWNDEVCCEAEIIQSAPCFRVEEGFLCGVRLSVIKTVL